MLQKSLIGILLLLIARFLDKVSAQYLYFLARERELLDINDLLVIKISSFYVLKGFWNIFWWLLFVASIIVFIANMTDDSSLNEQSSNSGSEDEDDDKEPEPPKRKRPTRASRRYKSRRYEVE